MFLSCGKKEKKNEQPSDEQPWISVFETWETKKCSATFYYQIGEKTDTVFNKQVDWTKESIIFENLQISQEELNNYKKEVDSLGGKSTVVFTKTRGKSPVESIQVAKEESGRLLITGRTKETNRLYTYEKSMELDNYLGYVIKIKEYTLLGDTVHHRIEVKPQCHD